MSMDSKVPEIRFKGFSGEWESFPLEGISDVLDGDRGHNYPNGEELKQQGHTLFLSASNVTKNGFRFDTRQYITQDKSESLGSGKLIIDDIVLTSRGSIGHIAWYNENITREIPFARINSGMLILRVKNNIDPSVISQYLNSPEGKKKIEIISFGSAQPQLTKASILKFPVTIPCKKPEQTQIGSYFQKLDALINQHQQKHDKLSNIKKAMLDKMFPKIGETIPEIRFKGFSGEWGIKKTSEICNISTGKNNTQDKVTNGKYPFYVRSLVIERSNNFLFDEEAVLTVGDGVGTGKVYHYINGKYDLHQRVYRMFEFKDVDAKYFYHYFSNNFYGRVISMTAKTSVDSVRLEMIADMDIFAPEINEQKRIASCLDRIDNLINQHHQQITKLNNIKRACLSKMFV